MFVQSSLERVPTVKMILSLFPVSCFLGPKNTKASIDSGETNKV
jgi:hypothetical protein